MNFQDLMGALPRSVQEHFHDELDRVDIGLSVSREGVLVLLNDVCSVVESSLNFEDHEKNTLVEFILKQLPKATLDAMFPA